MREPIEIVLDALRELEISAHNAIMTTNDDNGHRRTDLKI